MRVLLLAPHPFYQERGTPIAVDLLARTLAERGDRVDILTYHEGETPAYPDTITLYRIPPPPFAHGLRPGFSIKKLLCDAVMYPRAKALVQRHDYNIIHAVEESAFMARRLSQRYRIPYIFDMDSSMPRQIADKLPWCRPLLPLMRALENRAIRDAAAVVPMCDTLAEDARRVGARAVTVLRDISLLPENDSPNPGHGFRETLALKGPALLYLGNLESYQGIDLLLESFAAALADNPNAHLIIAGGRDDDIRHYTAKAETFGIKTHIHFLGPRPLSHMPDLFRDADILVSPRTQGANTPMKIYSYLDANRPILATALPTHTQVLDANVALLVPPTRDAMASGINQLLADNTLSATLATRAKQRARKHYSHTAFKTAVNYLYDGIASDHGNRVA